MRHIISGLAVVDTLLVLFNILGWSVGAWHIPSIYFQNHLTQTWRFPVDVMAYTTSTYLTVLVSVERYLAVCRKKVISIKKTKFYIIYVIVFAICMGLPLLWVYKYEETKDGVTHLALTELGCNKTFRIVYLFVVQICQNLILPTLCLIVFNILIFKEVSKKSK